MTLEQLLAVMKMLTEGFTAVTGGPVARFEGQVMPVGEHHRILRRVGTIAADHFGCPPTLRIAPNSGSPFRARVLSRGSTP